jgi:hypothetical protein
MTDEDPSIIPGLNRRMLLRGGLVAGVGAAMAGLATPALTGVAQAATERSAARRVKPAAVKPETTYDTQLYWAYCANCGELWYTNNKTSGWCAYQELNGGGGHIKSPSYSYQLAYNVSGTGGPSYQPNWNWCSRCQCLFYAPNVTDSYCPAKPYGERHNAGGYAYSVLYNDAVSGATQGNWRWCGQCQGLFTGLATCPEDVYGFHSAGPGSFNYDVAFYSTSPP